MFFNQDILIPVLFAIGHDAAGSLLMLELFYRKCGSTNFGKAGMIHEKKVVLAGQELSLRGNEETNLGNFDSKVNLDIE